MTRAEISQAVGNINCKFILEAEQYFQSSSHKLSMRKILVLAAILITILTLCAFTFTIFSTMAGDNLIITASYAGKGVVLAEVQNQSDRVLVLEPTIKLSYYSNQKLVPQTGEDPSITGLTIPAKTTQTVRIDLRQSYDIEALEKLTNDFVCLQVTNNRFNIGQKWTCIVSFRPNTGDYVPQYVTTGDTVRAENVIPSLKAYFENFTPDVFARWADVPNYLELVEQELAQIEGNIVIPADPFYYWDIEDHHTLVQSSCFDGYNKLLGRTDMEKIKHISIFVPRLLDGKELNGYQEIPIFYLWIFQKSEIHSPDDYAFIRGNLLTFREMDDYKVHEDDEFVIYEMHHLVYSDLRNYVEEMLIQNDSIYFDDEIWERIQRFYNEFSNGESLGKCIKPLDERFDRVPMDIDDVYSLSQKGKEITFSDLKPYSRLWKEIGDTYGYGVSFEIDAIYEFYYALHPNGDLKGYYLYHKPTSDSIDIRYEDITAFVNEHDSPLPRCECEDTENGNHGWQLSLDWLTQMDKDTILSYFSEVCHYQIESKDFSTYHYPVDDNRFYVDVRWNLYNESGEIEHTGEIIHLVHTESGDRCDVRAMDVEEFINEHI